MIIRSVFLLAALVLPLSGIAAGEPYPNRPILLVVPYAPGGAVDITARTIGPKLSKVLGQPVVIENKPGAGGTVGALQVVRSKPDGHTLLIGGTGPLSVAQVVMDKLPYLPATDLVPVSLLVLVPQVLVVHPDRPWKSAADLVAFARAHPGQIRAASGGIGTGQHLALMALMRQAGLDMIHVPYRGTSAAVQDVVAGHADLLFADPSVVPMVRSGKLRALAVTTPRRSSAMPDVPTMSEAGVPYNVQSFYACSAPAGTPPEVVQKLNDALKLVLSDPEVRSPLEAEGMIVTHTSPAQARAFIQDHITQAGKLLLGVKVKEE